MKTENNTYKLDPHYEIKDTSSSWHEIPGEVLQTPYRDARQIALESLRDYLCDFTFYRSPEKFFKLTPESFYLDGVESEDSFTMPAIAVLAAQEQVVGSIFPKIIESTLNQYKQGYVLLRITEHTEDFTLEIWTGTKSERRAILSAIDQMFTPVQDMVGLRLILKQYYNQPARFTLNHIERANDDGIHNRFRTLIHITLDVPVVRLVPATKMVPIIGVIDE